MRYKKWFQYSMHIKRNIAVQMNNYASDAFYFIGCCNGSFYMFCFHPITYQNHM